MPKAPDIQPKPTEAPAPQPIQAPVITQQPINGQPSGLMRPKRSTKKIILWVVSIVVGVVILVVSAMLVWYSLALQSVGTDKNEHILVTIDSGQTPSQIGTLLQSKKVIKSTIAFDIYTRLANKRNNLQAGTYRLSPAESTPAIVDHLVKGDVDEFSITFYPGATLKQHRQVLIDAGYTAAQVDAALTATYSSPLFDGKPASADLEGYIYGQTYKFSADATVSDILKRTFDQFYTDLTDNNLIPAMKSHGYSLYQAITLASIIQKEVASPLSTDPSSDQRQVAQVFYSRLANGMTLGSDVTYQYAADKLGVPRDPNLDSPYNTRRYTGLPPGPISSPGITALKAVANPASGNYLFFLSGDDNVTYFATTEAQHEANIKAHCQIKCSQL
jgi:UPF0755 protein